MRISTIKTTKMTSRWLASGLALALVGCGGGSGSGSSNNNPDNFPQQLTYFTLDDYQDVADSLGTDDIAGTWVGVRNITYTDANSSGVDVKRYESRLEFLVIRANDSAPGGYEMASCDTGGFTEIRSVSASDVATTGAGTYDRSADNRLTLTIPETQIATGVSLFSTSEFIRIKETVGAVGSMSWNWGPDQVVTGEVLFCAALHNLETSGRKLSLATTNTEEGNSVLELSTITYPFTERDVYFNDKVNALLHESEDSSDDIIIDVTDEDIYGYEVEFNITRSDASTDSVVGTISVDVTF